MTSLNLELPKIVLAKHYHHFSNAESFLSDVLDRNDVYVEELGFSTDVMKYVGLVYTKDSHPDNDTVQKLLEDKKIKIDMEKINEW